MRALEYSTTVSCSLVHSAQQSAVQYTQVLVFYAERLRMPLALPPLDPELTRFWHLDTDLIGREEIGAHSHCTRIQSRIILILNTYSIACSITCTCTVRARLINPGTVLVQKNRTEQYRTVQYMYRVTRVVSSNDCCTVLFEYILVLYTINVPMSVMFTLTHTCKCLVL